jgi:RecA/RadA recombinase
MGKNVLVEALRANEASKGKKADDYFNCNASVISYSTGFPVLDYYLGYKVNVCDANGDYVTSYPSLGITAGSYVLFIGKPSTSKTATAVKIAANIVRKFDNGTIIHFDLEQSMNYSRIQALTRLPMNDMREGKYILRQEKCTLEDMKSTIMRLYHEKVDNPQLYKYNTGLLNEFGEEIELFEPSVIILDSIATITMSLDGGDAKTLEKLEEVSSQTDRMRLTGEIGRFFNEIMSYLREANITLIAINQIKTNPQMGIVKSPAEILGLKQDETLPGGNTPKFLAHVLLKFVAVGSEKYSEEDEGFSGFKVKVEIIKSRVSAALKSVNLIYDKNTGVDMVRSTVDYAKDMGLISGNKNGYYFLTDKDEKFTLVNMPEDFRNNPKLYKIMKDNIIPLLETNLSGIRPEEMTVPDEEQDFYSL